MICLPTCSERLAELELQPMVAANTAQMQTRFTVTIDAKEVTTGISAQERAYTIQKFVDANAVPSDFVRPGHIFPLEAKPGGVLRRAGHTEATVDLARMAGLYPAGVLCEILNEDGSMARVPELMVFATKHQLKIITISDLIAYRRQTETLIRRVATADIPTAHGEFKLYAYESTDTGGENVETDKTHICPHKRRYRQRDTAFSPRAFTMPHRRCLRFTAM